jgi:hypothetical protein
MQDIDYTRVDLEEITELLQSQKREMEISAANLQGSDMKGTLELQSKLESYLK